MQYTSHWSALQGTGAPGAMTKVAVVSEPLKELVGEGKNAKYVVDTGDMWQFFSFVA